MKPSQVLSRLAHEMSSRTKTDYNICLEVVSRQNPDLAAAANTNAPSAAELANDRARADAVRAKTEAKQKFLGKVRELQGRGHDYDQAWRIASRDNVELANSMNAPLPASRDLGFVGKPNSGGKMMDGTAPPQKSPVRLGQGTQTNPTNPTPSGTGGPTPGAATPPALFTAGMCAMLGLGRVDQSEALAAWKANGNRFNPVDHAQIFTGLVAHHADTDDVTQETATNRVREAHPSLASNYDLATSN